MGQQEKIYFLLGWQSPSKNRYIKNIRVKHFVVLMQSLIRDESSIEDYQLERQIPC